MIRSRVRRPVPIPRVSTDKSQTKDYQFVKGFNANLSNDDVPPDQWRLVQDAREIQIGKWRTRQGNDLLSIPVGEAVNAEQTATTGTANFAFGGNVRFAAKVTATVTGRLTALEARLRNASGATGTIVLAVYDDNGGSPGTELMRTTIANSAVTSSYQYLKARSITCPDITIGSDYWVVGFVQDGGSGTYEISTTTAATTGKTSTDSGSTWGAQSFAFNVKLSTATSGAVKGCVRVRRPSGTTYTFFSHGNTLYSVDEVSGVATAVDTSLSSTAAYCRFQFVNDVLYYVTGGQKPRKYNFTSASEVTAAPENAKAIIEHKGVVFYLSAADETKMYYTNFGAYETFTSTDFIYIPAPKTSDPGTAFAKLNGVLYILTRNNKHVLYGAENATFRLDEAIGQEGTFSQESVAFDKSAIYLANESGIYRFNGSEERNIAADPDGGIINRWMELLNKENTVLTLHNNRLYVWYTPNGESRNSRCFVWNTLYGIWESDDTLGYVGAAHSKLKQDNYLVQGSNRVGMLMLGERPSNDYNALGEPLDTELDTVYQHYGTPAQFKRARLYRPHFDTEGGNYSVQVGYATDYNGAATYNDVPLAGFGPRFDAGYRFDTGEVFGGSQQVNPRDIVIPGDWLRLQLRYRHYAAREPFSFDGHVLQLETQRLI